MTHSILSDFTRREVTEEEVVSMLLNPLISEAPRPDLRAFSHVLDLQEFRKPWGYKGIYFASSVTRQELRLSRKGKPGDIDILIIPFNNSSILFERAAVIEVKVIRPTIKNPKRNANSLGVSQINGMIDDGFSFIGLIHVCVPEPLPAEHLREVRRARNPLYLNDPEKGKDFDPHDVELVMADLFPIVAVKNQMRRLVSLNFPDFIGLRVLGFSFEKGGRMIMSWSTEFFQNEHATRNPKVNPKTIQLIKRHFERQSDRYTRIDAAKRLED